MTEIGLKLGATTEDSCLAREPENIGTSAKEHVGAWTAKKERFARRLWQWLLSTMLSFRPDAELASLRS